MKKRKATYGLAAALRGKEPDRVPSVIYEGEIMWSNGQPSLRRAPARISSAPADALLELVKIALDLPYDGRDPALANLSQGEAIAIQMVRQAADGDSTARGEILDRILGRPQQNIKAVHLTGDINDLLDKVAAETRTVVIDTEGNHIKPEDDL